MKKNKLINTIINYKPPKIVLLLLVILPALIVFTKKEVLDNDIWFLLNHGKYVLSHGFPTIEPFSIHEGLSFIIQQWLSASIFWIAYKFLGDFGLRLILLIVTLLITYFIYKICMLLSNKKIYVSYFISFIVSMLMLLFLTTRPQIFTFLILLIEVYLIELYIKTKKRKYLYFLPLLSLLEINLHASMWFMQFVFILPFIIDSYKINLGFISSEGYDRKPLFIIILIMALVGFINPYGVKSILYIFSSYGIEEINIFILEMKPLTINGFVGKSYFLVFFAVLFFYIFYDSNKKYKLRYFLFYCGTLYLALSNVKGVPYFLMMGIIPVSYYIKDSSKESHVKKYPKKFEYICLCIVLIIFGATTVVAYNRTPNMKTLKVKKATDYILKNYDKNKIKVYADYNDGGFVEFNGIKSYIDPRAEVFLKKNNKKEDIFIEYYNVSNYKLDCLTFLEKYKFDLLLLENNSVLHKCAYNKYKQVYRDNYRCVLERIK